MNDLIQSVPHKRYNILTGEWVLVSPHRTRRPWQGKRDKTSPSTQNIYDKDCYLCPGNERAGGERNPDYTDAYSFVNDFSALVEESRPGTFEKGLLQARQETGICKVICFSSNHALTLPLMSVTEIKKVIRLWKQEYLELGRHSDIKHVMIFENKGEIMGCSNPHPHGQIWSQSSIPQEVLKKQFHQREYWNKNHRSLLQSYVEQEIELDERIVYKNSHFVVLVPFWAIWPYETMIVPLNHYQNISQLNEEEEESFAMAIKVITVKYDNLFEISFPYSSGIHQCPTDYIPHPEWHFHMSFYPPLLRSADVKKFMVGYEMFAYPQRDITAEQVANTLILLPSVHYTGIRSN